MREHSGIKCFGVSLLRQLSLQLLFLPREKQGGIRNFASHCGSVASNSPNRRKNTMREHSGIKCFGVTLPRQLSLQFRFLPREKQGWIRMVSNSPTLENKMRKHSGIKCFGVSLLRQLSLQLLFLPREKRGGIRHFAAYSGSVAFDSPSHRKDNSRARWGTKLYF